MKKWFICCCLLICSYANNTKEAQILEWQASNYMRLAQNSLHLAQVYEKNTQQKQTQQKKAQEQRQRANKYLQKAEKYLKKAIFLRKKIMAVNAGKLGSINSKKRSIIRIASWNIQNFGESKMGKILPYKGKEYTVPEIIADIILEAKFSVVALQEIEGENLEAIERVVTILNQIKGREIYRMTYPEKLGTSANTAEYLPIIYNAELVKVKTQGMIKGLTMQRQPHYALFSLKEAKFQQAKPQKEHFDFCLVSVHLAPKGSREKDLPRQRDFSLLPKIFRKLSKKFNKEDIIITGDFNCDPNRGGIDGKLWEKIREKGGIIHPITQRNSTVIAQKTMTKGKRVNDNMIWMEQSEEDWAGRKEVYNYSQLHFVTPDGSIDNSSARVISDHLPIWSEFYTGQDSD